MIAAIQRLMAPLSRRINVLVSRATIYQVDDSGSVQTVQVSMLDGERLSGVVRLQQFGLSGNPPAGASGLLLSIGGTRSNPVFILGEDASRPTDLPPGASAIYDDAGNYLRFNNDGTWYLKAATSGTVDCPNVKFTGNGEIAGNLKVDGNAEIGGNLKVDGTSEFVGAVTFDSSVSGTNAGASATFAGALKSNTSVADASGTLGALRSAYDSHKHPGVQGGSGSTGTTDTPA